MKGDCVVILAMLQNGRFQSQIPENDYTQLLDIIPMEKIKVNDHTRVAKQRVMIDKGIKLWYFMCVIVSTYAHFLSPVENVSSLS
jgi:hypothetical protein